MHVSVQTERSRDEALTAGDEDRSLRRIHDLPEGLTLDRRVRAPDAAADPYRHEAARRDDLTLTWRWRGKGHTNLLGFTVLWDLIVVPIAAVIIGDGAFGLMLAFSPFVAAAVGLTYFAIANAVSRTVIEIDGDRLTARQRPLPTRRRRVLRAAAIEQLHVARTSPYEINEQPVFFYTVRARLRDGRALDLVPNMHTPEQALWVEQQLEDCLGLVDRPVAGELEAGVWEP